MANPYHDAEGKFCTKEEMQQAIKKAKDDGNIEVYFDLRTDFQEIERKKSLSVITSTTNLMDRIIIEHVLSHSGPSAELWANSKHERFFADSNGKRRGKYGEEYFKRMLQKEGIVFEKAESSDYDARYNGHRVEIKTNASDYAEPNKRTINMPQIRPKQEYDYLISQIISPNDVNYYMIPHSDVRNLITKEYIKPQHGGGRYTREGEFADTYVTSGPVRTRPWLKPYEKSFIDIVEVFKTKKEDTSKK